MYSNITVLYLKPPKRCQFGGTWFALFDSKLKLPCFFENNFSKIDNLQRLRILEFEKVGRVLNTVVIMYKNFAVRRKKWLISSILSAHYDVPTYYLLVNCSKKKFSVMVIERNGRVCLEKKIKLNFLHT